MQFGLLGANSSIYSTILYIHFKNTIIINMIVIAYR